MKRQEVFAPFCRLCMSGLKIKLFIKQNIYKALKNTDEQFDRKKLSLLFAEHHLSHAASAFYTSGFDTAAILTIDGVGEYATTSLAFWQREFH
jgi:carbamoyltransferase